MQPLQPEECFAGDYKEKKGRLLRAGYFARVWDDEA